jgi:6-phosphogluconolactonase
MKMLPKSRLRFVPIWFIAALFTRPAAAADNLVIFGSHAAGPNRGLSVAHFDSTTGALTKPELVVESPAPAFFVIHPDGRHLYACNSTDYANGWPGETVSAFAIDPAKGRLSLINQQPCGGADPSYITLDATSRYALVANYQGGNIAVLALKPDGGLGERTALVQHTGSSVDPKRQTHPYAHSIRLDPTNRFALVADLGLDKLFVYRFDPKDGSLQPNDPPFVKVAPGSGPRHLAFHPNGRRVYLVNEMASTVIAYAWDSTRGALTELQTISTLPADFKGTSACAEIEVHPNGRFLYATNRGHDSVAVFAIDAATGKLTLIEHIPSQGHMPRNFAFDPSSRWLIVTNHGSDNAVVFRVDENTGHLSPVGQPVHVLYPFGVRFLPVP